MIRRAMRSRSAFVGLALAVPALSWGIARAEVSEAEARTILARSVSSWDLGDPIRVTSSEPPPIRWTGRFYGLEGDSALRMSVSRSDGSVAVQVRQIGILEEKIGTKRYWGEGAVVGLLVGGLIGAAIGETYDEEEEFLEGLGRGLTIQIGALSGLVVGGVVGYTIKSNRWGIVATFD